MTWKMASKIWDQTIGFLNNIRSRLGAGRAQRLILSSGLFNADWYAAQYPDVALSGQDPLKHFIRHGMKEMRSPSSKFDAHWYAQQHPDILKAGAVPLLHYITFGAHEGRSPTPPVENPVVERPGDAGADALDAKVLYLKQDPSRRYDEWVLFVTHSPWGALNANVEPYLRAFAQSGVGVFLIVAADRPVVLSPTVQTLCARIIVRENVGYDFAAWAHALRLHPELYDAAALYFANDSVFGPASEPTFKHVIDRARASGADIVGLTESFEYGWHVQSYFFCLKPGALSTFYIQSFFSDVHGFLDKESVIQNYEVKLTGAAIGQGLTVEVLFEGFEHSNPTLRSWDKLLDAGFPFIKTSLLKGADAGVDLTGWRSKARRAGFDLDVIDAVLEAKQIFAPLSAPDPRLALEAPPAGATPSIQDLKVGFYGPWNYNSGLAVASKGLVSALRLLGVRLNLHPVKQGFHIHHRAAPSLDICDFEGDADVAIVHLNPEAWRLLTEDQRAAIARARRVIGYWVWEMAHLPDDWGGGVHRCRPGVDAQRVLRRHLSRERRGVCGRDPPCRAGQKRARAFAPRRGASPLRLARAQSADPVCLRWLKLSGAEKSRGPGPRLRRLGSCGAGVVAGPEDEAPDGAAEGGGGASAPGRGQRVSSADRCDDGPRGAGGAFRGGGHLRLASRLRGVRPDDRRGHGPGQGGRRHRLRRQSGFPGCDERLSRRRQGGDPGRDLRSLRARGRVGG